MHKVIVCLSMVACLAVCGARAAAVADPDLSVQTWATGLSSPSGMAFIGDDDVLVLEQLEGKVRRVVGGTLLPDPVLDLPVDNLLLDRGLLGIAIDPEFRYRPFVYLFYIEAAVDGGTGIATRVTRFRWDGATLVEPRLVLDLPIRDNVFRVGGIVLFGPDDKLYTVMGDLQFTGKLQNRRIGPDPNDTSVILRTYSDGIAPRDNPFAGSTGTLAPMNRYFAYGLRNSFGMTFDPVNGTLWNTENGEGVYDEINRVLPGFNSGWTQIQGPDVRDPQGVADLWMAPGAHYSDPESSWNVPVAPTAIDFVRSPRMGCGRLHDLLSTGVNCGALYSFELNVSRSALQFASPELADLVVDNAVDQCTSEQAEIQFGSNFGVVTDMETGPDGNYYVVSLDNGAIYRIVPNRPAAVDPDGDGAENTCDCAPAAAGAWGVPGPIPRLRVFGSAPTHLGWDDSRAALGSATVHHVVSGSLSSLRTSGGFLGACTLATALAVNTVADARPAPVPGDGNYYLARSSNACGPGTYGDSSVIPDPRNLLDAGAPLSCP